MLQVEKTIKYFALIFVLICVCVFSSCGDYGTGTIKITIPAGSTAPIVFSTEEFSPTGSTITILSEIAEDTEVKLKPVFVRQENAYDETTYLTPGMPVKMNVEKDARFKIGVALQNPSDTDKIVIIKIIGIKTKDQLEKS